MIGLQKSEKETGGIEREEEGRARGNTHPKLDYKVSLCYHCLKD